MYHFEIKDCALLSRMSGLPVAVNLRELHDRIASCSDDVLYHHYCETTLVPSFDYPDYRNDFAVWVKKQLGDDILAERLGMIDPYSFSSLGELRAATLEIIDERLSELPMIPWARRGHEFHFMEATTVIFDTGKRITHPDQLISAIKAMTKGSIYFHFLEARRRTLHRKDDFSVWLQDWGAEWRHYILAMKTIDFAFNTLAELRDEIVRILEGKEKNLWIAH
jgi:Family of unknown function (DUF5752)